MPITVDRNGDKGRVHDPKQDALNDISREDAAEPAKGPKDEFVPEDKSPPKAPKTAKKGPVRKQTLLFGKRPDLKKTVLFDGGNSVLIRGNTDGLRDVAGYMLDIWDTLLNKATHPAYELGVSWLRGITKLHITFEENSSDSLTVKDVRRSSDGTLDVTLAMSRQHVGEIVRNLDHGTLAFLIITAAKRKGSSSSSLELEHIRHPELYAGNGHELLKTLIKETERFFKDKNASIAGLKASLRKNELPKGVKEALLGLGVGEKEAERIFDEMATNFLYFDLIENPKLPKDNILVRNIDRSAVAGGDSVKIEYDINPATLKALGTVELYQLLARGYIYSTFYPKNEVARNILRRSEISSPITMYALFSYEIQNVVYLKKVFAGTFAKGWLNGISEFFSTLQGIGKFIADERADVRRPNLMPDFVAANAKKGVLTIDPQLQKMVALFRNTPVWRQLELFSDVWGYIVRIDPDLKGSNVTVNLYPDNGHLTLEMGVSRSGYEKLTVMDILTAVGDLKVGEHGKRRPGQNEPHAPEKSSVPMFLAFFRLWMGYSAREARLDQASRMDIDGGASRSVLNAAGASLVRIFASSKKEYFSAEGAAIQAWLKEQKVIVIEQVESMERPTHVLRSERIPDEELARREKTYKKRPVERWTSKWVPQTREIIEVSLIPAENGLMILVSGHNPTPAQWDHLFVAAYLGRERAFSIRFDNKGDVNNISMGGEFIIRLNDYMERLSGRQASTTLGAEGNEAWVACMDAELKARYVEALRWMRENRGNIPDYLQPKPTDDAETLQGKYRTFSKLFHPDYAKTPAEAELFKNGTPYWDILRKLAPSSSKGDVVIGPANDKNGIVTVDARGNGTTDTKPLTPEQLISKLLEKARWDEEDILKLAKSLGSDAERLKVQMKERSGDLWDYLRLYVKEDVRDRFAERFKDTRAKRADTTSKPREIFKGK